MSSLSEVDDVRRRLLVSMLAVGALGPLAGCAGGSATRAFPQPQEMPPGRSIFEFGGDVRVNGLAATLATPVSPGDLVETGADSFVIFVLNKDAAILRSNSSMLLPAAAGQGYNLSKGKALTVLASRKTRLVTPSAVVGIRGTGVYLEVEPDQSYVCTCYGVADLAAASDPAVSETITSEHHDAPRYISSGSGGNAASIRPAPFINHDDEELLLIETLVGRTTPYVVPRRLSRTRRTYI